MGWETGNGEKKNCKLITNNISEFPILIHTTKWFWVRSQDIESKRSAQTLTQSNSTQEVVRRQRVVPHSVTLQSGQGSEVRVKRSV